MARSRFRCVSVPSTVAPVFSATYGTSAMWSKWAWVMRIESAAPMCSSTADSSIVMGVSGLNSPGLVAPV